jgi:hypothetical protein
MWRVHCTSEWEEKEDAIELPTRIVCGSVSVRIHVSMHECNGKCKWECERECDCRKSHHFGTLPTPRTQRFGRSVMYYSAVARAVVL